MRFSSARDCRGERDCTAMSIFASSAWARSGVMLVDSAVRSAASPRTTTGSVAPTTPRYADELARGVLVLVRVDGRRRGNGGYESALHVGAERLSRSRSSRTGRRASRPAPAAACATGRDDRLHRRAGRGSSARAARSRCRAGSTASRTRLRRARRRRARARSAVGSGPLNRSSTNGAVATAARVAAGGVEHERLRRRERMGDGDERLVADGDPIDQHVAGARSTTASLVGAGSMNDDCAADGRVRAERRRSDPRALRGTRSGDNCRARPRRATAASIGTYGVGRTSVVDRVAAASRTYRNDGAIRGSCRAEPLPRLGGLRARSRATSGSRRRVTSSVGDLVEPAAGLQLRDDLRDRPCRRAASIGIGDRLPDERHRELLVDRLRRARCRRRPARSRTTPTSTPVFTSCTSTGYTPGWLIPILGGRPSPRART